MFSQDLLEVYFFSNYEFPYAMLNSETGTVSFKISQRILLNQLFGMVLEISVVITSMLNKCAL